jgi:hypothetical protein
MKQADLLLIGVQAVGFGVDGDAGVIAQFGDQLEQLSGPVDPGGLRCRIHTRIITLDGA